MDLAMLTALNRAPEIKLHVKGALNNGVTVRGDQSCPVACYDLLRNSGRARRLPGRTRSVGQRGRAAKTRNVGQVVGRKRLTSRRALDFSRCLLHNPLASLPGFFAFGHRQYRGRLTSQSCPSTPIPKYRRAVCSRCTRDRIRCRLTVEPGVLHAPEVVRAVDSNRDPLDLRI